ncbi:sensor histidine kinase [Clostridium guangxiense]|uniref:sensor histidine kinase n=1 Tax=Clostridium guangxiense TaxID=1662055 RepID=UPI001E4156BE|nr:HAMP domain-containing sensor histidine kinase [Clostridium guangxiense]MCD2347099.1 HAMP domain-containing histidine kinase [Clostridium guangxiense]
MEKTMKSKKLDAYRTEFKIILLLVIALVLTIITESVIQYVSNIVEELLRLYSYSIFVKLIRARDALSSLYSIMGYFEFAAILAIYCHLIFRKKVALFLEIDNTVKTAANGNFQTRIQNISQDDLGRFSQNVNKVMDKFNLALENQKKAEQTKINLITSISHDLRTPLTSILGYLKLIDNDEYDGEITLRTYANIALNKTNRLKLLIDNLFELTTLNDYGIKLSKKKVNVTELIKQLIIEHTVNFKKANIECRLIISDEQLYVLGDFINLARAFENLIFNCIKYSKTSKFMDIALNKNASKITLEFTNYGEPIPSKDIPYIFQRFYRVDKSRSSETGGSGLGLAITKNIIELHNGKISVESNVSKTTFKIELPCLSEEETIYD